MSQKERKKETKKETKEKRNSIIIKIIYDQII